MKLPTVVLHRSIPCLLSAASCAAALMVCGAFAASQTAAPAVIKNQAFLPFADAPIHYRASALHDPIAKLEKRLENGEATRRNLFSRRWQEFRKQSRLRCRRARLHPLWADNSGTTQYCGTQEVPGADSPFRTGGMTPAQRSKSSSP